MSFFLKFKKRTQNRSEGCLEEPAAVRTIVVSPNTRTHTRARRRWAQQAYCNVGPAVTVTALPQSALQAPRTWKKKMAFCFVKISSHRAQSSLKIATTSTTTWRAQRRGKCTVDKRASRTVQTPPNKWKTVRHAHVLTMTTVLPSLACFQILPCKSSQRRQLARRRASGSSLLAQYWGITHMHAATLPYRRICACWARGGGCPAAIVRREKLLWGVRALRVAKGPLAARTECGLENLGIVVGIRDLCATAL